jgi:glycosyltransferase involved in cell wall biosynthesis
VTTVSIVIPVKDEQDTILPLVEKILAVFDTLDSASVILEEVVIVDDGSRDRTWDSILLALKQFPKVKGIRFRRNLGKAAALREGAAAAHSEIVITMDGDLQDDPAEIPRFIAAINSGYDVVSGWKQLRHDPLAKTLPSKVFNVVTSFVTGVRIHDFNCGYKAYRKEVFDEVFLYGELHRFVPALAHDLGFKVTEIVVQHHPRQFGKSKYGVARLFKGFLDLLTIVTITRFNSRPNHLFGGIGVIVEVLGLGMLFYLTMLRFQGYVVGERPLLIVSAIFMIVGLQFILFGMIAELLLNQRWRGVKSSLVIDVVSSETAKSPKQ